MMLLLGLLILGAGLFMLLCPDLWWELTESWKTYAGEPSDLYRKGARFGGVCCLLVGIAGIVAFFVL